MVEAVGDLAVGQVRQAADHIDRAGVGVAPLLNLLIPGHDKLVGGAGMPADPDAGLADVGFWQQADISNEGAQQPFAVPGGSAGGMPEAGDITGECLEFSA